MLTIVRVKGLIKVIECVSCVKPNKKARVMHVNLTRMHMNFILLVSLDLVIYDEL